MAPHWCYKVLICTLRVLTHVTVLRVSFLHPMSAVTTPLNFWMPHISSLATFHCEMSSSKVDTGYPASACCRAWSQRGHCYGAESSHGGRALTPSQPTYDGQKGKFVNLDSEV